MEYRDNRETDLRMKSKKVYYFDDKLIKIDTSSSENKYRVVSPNAEYKINESTKEPSV